MDTKPRKESMKLARTITKSMATWRFIFFFLAACGIEIWGNKTGLFRFDPTMLVLNTILSLLAAIQGSVIMIYQDHQDEKRDQISRSTEKNTESILRVEKKTDKHLTSIDQRLAAIEGKLNT